LNADQGETAALTYLSMRRNEDQLGDFIILSLSSFGDEIEDCQNKSIKKGLGINQALSLDPQVAQRILK